MAIVHAQEIHVSYAEARFLPNVNCGPRLVREDGVVTPLVDADEAVHRSHRLKGEGRADVLQGLVRQPRDHARHRQRFPPADHEHLRRPELHARPDVLDREGAASYDRDLLSHGPAVVELVRDAIDDVPVELLLAFVDHPPGNRQVPGEEAHRGHLHRAPLALPIQGQLVGLGGVVSAEDVHLRDLRVHVAVRQDAELLRGLLEPLQQLVPRGPWVHTAIRRPTVVLVIL
mmetsp:Transcript_81192/g.235501  ORF Transcript_81192/g.235501 Transcript_81192/m.235501 type:complete len:230 (-) Transcript_81192:537-1226(-)